MNNWDSQIYQKIRCKAFRSSYHEWTSDNIYIISS
jgi:hypothetical protein